VGLLILSLCVFIYIHIYAPFLHACERNGERVCGLRERVLCVVVVFDVSLFVFSSFLCVSVCVEDSIYIKFTNLHIQAMYMLLPVSPMLLHGGERERTRECLVVCMWWFETDGERECVYGSRI